MKFVEFNPVDEKGNCILRSLTKILDKDYYDVKEELLNLTKQLGYTDYREDEVLETFFKMNNIEELENFDDIKISNLNLENGRYLVYCWDKKDFYHMATIIDNVLYDKNDSSMELYVVKLYKSINNS